MTQGQVDHALEKEESGPPAHGHDSRAEREKGRERGGESCEEDSSEERYLRETQRKTRGGRGAEGSEEARRQRRGQGDTRTQYIREHITESDIGGTWASAGL